MATCPRRHSCTGGLSASWGRETASLGRRISRWDIPRAAVVGNPRFVERGGKKEEPGK